MTFMLQQRHTPGHARALAAAAQGRNAGLLHWRAWDRTLRNADRDTACPSPHTAERLLRAVGDVRGNRARKSRLKQMAETSTRAQNALRLTENPERFLSTVQVGITLISVLTGVYGGATIGARISLFLQGRGVELDLANGSVWPSASGAITYVSIIVGELLPKRLALVAPERFAVWIAYPMRVFATVATPFVVLLTFSTRVLLKALRLDRGSRDPVTEEEIRLLVAESAEQGVIDSDEHIMVNRVLRLGDRQVTSLMTPRTRIAWLGHRRATRGKPCGHALNPVFALSGLPQRQRAGSGRHP